MNTAELMGYANDARLLIVNADDFGLCHSANEGIRQLLSENAVCSTTIMMNCAWSASAAARIREAGTAADVGVHWTLTSEWPRYRWGPLCRSRAVRSLSGPDGWFPSTIAETERRADPEEVRHELIAQTEAALAAGLSLTHADNHMGSLYGFSYGNDLLDVAFDVCALYKLPFRLPRTLLPVGGMVIPAELQERARLRARQAEDRGIVLPDYVTGLDYRLGSGETYESMKAEGIVRLKNLLPGVTEWITHPSLVADELKSFLVHWEKRGMEHRFWLDPDVRGTIASEGIRLIGWRELQLLQISLSV